METEKRLKKINASIRVCVCKRYQDVFNKCEKQPPEVLFINTRCEWKKIAKKLEKVNIVLISENKNAHDEAIEAFTYRVSDFIAKPFT